MKKFRFACNILLPILAIALMGKLNTSLKNARNASFALEASSPFVRYVMVVLGGFRGIISEVLWIRASTLQDQGRFLELIQLTDWITTLDPKAVDAWAYNSWNLAYNISAMLPDNESKLNYVNGGIKLLRDHGIKANPKSPVLYKELGWLYQDKIGMASDPAHITYKLNLAKEVEAFMQGRESSLVLDRETMMEIEAKFGQLDWRMASTHAIYWAWIGLKQNPKGFEFEALRRMVQQNLVILITRGRFTGDISRGIWASEPDFDLLPVVMAYYEESAANDKSERRIYSIFLNAISPILLENNREDLALLAKSRLDSLRLMEAQ